MNRIEIAIHFTIIPWFHDSMNDWRVIMMKWESGKGRSHGNGCYINIKKMNCGVLVYEGISVIYFQQQKSEGENIFYAV